MRREPRADAYSNRSRRNSLMSGAQYPQTSGKFHPQIFRRLMHRQPARALERWNVGYCRSLQNSVKSSWRACSNRIGLRVRTRSGYTSGNGTRILWRSLKDFEGDGWYLVQEPTYGATRSARIRDIPVHGMHVTLLRRGDPREVIAPGI